MFDGRGFFFNRMVSCGLNLVCRTQKYEEQCQGPASNGRLSGWTFGDRPAERSIKSIKAMVNENGHYTLKCPLSL